MVKQILKIAKNDSLLEKKAAAKEIFGSNLRLASCKAVGKPIFPYAAAQSAAAMIGQKEESLILERLYYKIRTYFQQNPDDF